MGKLGKKARKFAKKNLQSVMRRKRKLKSMFKRKKSSAANHLDGIEKSGGLSSEKHEEENFGEATREAAPCNNSFDNIYIDDVGDLVEDGSDSEGFLSEDPECPYISERETESNCKDGSDHASLSENNKEIHMEIVEQKRKLERLLKDPRFSEFLGSRRADLEKSTHEEIYSDEEGDTNDPDGASVEEDQSLHDRKALNSYTLDVWCWLVMEQPKGPALPNLLNAFRAACHYGFDSDESPLHEIPDKDVFCKVLTFVLSEADNIFRKRLGISDSCSKESLLKLETTPEWKINRSLIKSYLRSCLLLLNQATDSMILSFVLSRLKVSIVFLSAFPSLAESFIKVLVHLWVTGEESLYFSSYLVICEMASKLQSRWYDTCLLKTYKAFVAHSKYFEPTKLKHFDFLENTIVELYSLDMQKSYQQVLASLQHLANILQHAIRTKKKEDLKKIPNWQYVNCISLWVKFICCNFKEHDLQPLLSLCTLVLKGIAYLFPGPRYVPLRFRCMQMLNQLSLSSGVFISVASLVFDCLECKGKENVTVSAREKPFNFSSVLKVPKNLLKTRSFQEECVLSAVELLSTHFLQWSHHISFPELATIPLILIKRFHDKLTDDALHRQVKRFIEQVEQNREFIERKRDGVSFSPNDQAAIDFFLQPMVKCGSSSFIQYYTSMLHKSQSRHSTQG